MKVLVVILKVSAVISILCALMAFGSDLLSVDGFHFGGHESAEGSHKFYKIVPTDGVNPYPIGAVLFLAGITLFVISALIKKHLVK